MRYIRLFIIAVISFLAAINGTLLKKILSIFLCGVINLNSPAWNTFFSDRTFANVAPPPISANSTIQAGRNRVGGEAELSSALPEIPQVVAQIPRVRQQTHSSERDAPELNTPPPKVKPSTQKPTNTSPRKPQSTANNPPLFTPSFRRLSEDTGQGKRI
ncbi:MAG: hypothetical protein KME30_29600 [Iphinoe sp. HA4291-MV1]|jgi:hypothetical protein|nr:hypothetical protein [Iphinoe sp. HA4291-MV1]